MKAIKTRQDLIKEYVDFFKSKNHKEIPNSSLIPENDPTVLFTTAGMHPLVPYLLGGKHPLGKRLVNCQKCIRTGDIDSVGDAFHLTFFEMLGNWSLGDYWKKEAIGMSLDFLARLGIKKENLTISCFAGDKTASKDEESAKIWQDLGIKAKQIKFLGKEENWWGPAGKTGPCGPDTEMFLNDMEVWNDVFMQYNKKEDGSYEPLKQKNVDTGMGVERTLAILQGKKSVYETECFLPLIKEIEKLSKRRYGQDKDETRAMRIIADHIKASVFILGEGIQPSNTEQGYVLRRLIRRAIRYGKFLMMQNNFTKDLAEIIIEIYPDYKYLEKNKTFILQEIEKEENRFRQSLAGGLNIAKKIFSKKIPISKEKFSKLMQNPNKSFLIGRIFDLKRHEKNYTLKDPKLSQQEIDNATINGDESFLLFQSYGFPLEMIDELAMEYGLLVDHDDFRIEQTKHQIASGAAIMKRFKSGLADNSEQVTKLHTATHLLNQALRVVLKKPDIFQKGSNITAERLRFDFNFDRKLTNEEIKEVENLVNKKIHEKLPVECKEMPLQEAKKIAQGVFLEKYGEKVKVYSIGNFSREICAGPHISNTKDLGKFKITKEESVAAGVRRIKAVLE